MSEIDLGSRAALIDFLLDPNYDICLVRGTYLHHLQMLGKKWPRRQEMESEAFVTKFELLRWKATSGIMSNWKGGSQCEVRIIAVSHVWETREHPDPLGHQLQILAEARLWPASRSWYFIDYMSIYQFYRGEEDNPQQQCFVRAMSQMHVLYSHEATYTYQISTLPRWVDVDAPTDAHVAVFYCPDPNEPCTGSVQLIPVWALMRNDTPYSQRGWCQAELQWSCMRSDSSRLIILDAHTPNQASMAPMPPEVFEQLVGNGSLKFTHRNDMEAVLQLQRSIFHTKALATQCLVLARLPFEQVLRLTSALHHYTSLKELSVRQSQFSTAAAEKLVEGLELVPCVEIIDLQANDINDEVAIPLAKLLIVCRNIKTLNLSLNCIGDDGAVAIAEALGRGECCYLQAVLLESNQIGCRGSCAFAFQFRHGAKLQELNLAMNPIRSCCLGAWSEAMSTTVLKLKRLHLKNTELVGFQWFDLQKHTCEMSREWKAVVEVVGFEQQQLDARRQAANYDSCSKTLNGIIVVSVLSAVIQVYSLSMQLVAYAEAGQTAGPGVIYSSVGMAWFLAMACCAMRIGSLRTSCFGCIECANMCAIYGLGLGIVDSAVGAIWTYVDCGQASDPECQVYALLGLIFPLVSCSCLAWCACCHDCP